MTDQAIKPRRFSAEVRQAIVKWVIQSAMGVIGYGAILFAAAGSLRWLGGWLMLALMAATITGQTLTLIAVDPALLLERSKGIRAEGTKPWDRWLVLFGGGLLPAIAWVIGGLDARFGWPGSLPLWAQALGVVGYALGMTLFHWAMASNAFFAEGVRIQPERGHTPATGGPYRVVRHPGYVGAIVSFFATPLVLGSAWAAIPSVVGAALYVVRTALEDRTLLAELPGYRAFADQTRFRLIPGIW